jgi:hypothetical protein
MTIYWAAELSAIGRAPAIVSGPWRTFTAAADDNARRVGVDAFADPSRCSILLDVRSVAVDSEDELRTLLMHDPVLRAIYEYGRGDGAR